MFIPEWLIWAVVTLFSLALFVAVIAATLTVARRRRARFAEPEAAAPAADFAVKDSDFTAGRPGTWTPLEGPAIIEDEPGR